MAKPTAPHDGQHPGSDRTVALEEADRSDTWIEAEEILPLVEETATVEKHEIVTGKVRVRTITETLEELTKANLQSGTVEVTRVPIDKVVDMAPEIRTEGNLTIVPVLEEVLVVTKQLVLKEELHIRRRVKTEAVEVPITRRKQRAIVERVAPEDSTINTEETDR